jgi:methylated-DNA-protein-cysteine methyltransferase-like protein
MNSTKIESAEIMSKKRPQSQGFVPDQLSTERAKKRLLRDALRPNELRDLAFRRMILSIPPGKVSTYGRIAAAAGYPRYHRAVAKLLRVDPVDQLPWHRVVGAGGEIKLRGAAAHEQRARLALEGVRFDGRRVDMENFEYSIKPWEVYG